MRRWYRRWEPVFGLVWLGFFVGYWADRIVGPVGWAAPVVVWVGLGWLLSAWDARKARRESER